MKNFQRSVLAFLVLVTVCAVVVFPFLLSLRRFAARPMAPDAPQQTVSVAPGMGMAAIARQLERQQIVASARKLRLLAALRRDDRHIQVGEYQLSGAMSPDQVLDTLISGKVLRHPVTIPEGYQLSQIAAVLETAGLVDAREFLRYATDPNETRKLGIDAATMEGYLFPDTYWLTRTMRPADIAAVMVRRFRQVFTDAWKQRADEIGMSVHEVVTLASIIEKETGQGAERPLISSVFHNRLRRGMRLETDPTVIYGLSQFDGNLTRRHLRQPGPYNTYLNQGLPPGPIASPGAESLKAALYPADTGFLYFVARRDHTHQFSATLQEHNRAVRKYQLRSR